MPEESPIVFVVDDDPQVRDSIGQLLRSLGMETRLFASVSDFLKSDKPDGPACLVLDVRLPGRSGLEFQRDLAAANRDLPIIFITGHGDIPMTVKLKAVPLNSSRSHFVIRTFSMRSRPALLVIVPGGQVKGTWLRSGSVLKR